MQELAMFSITPLEILAHRFIRRACLCNCHQTVASNCPGWEDIAVYVVLMSDDIMDELEGNSLPRQLLDDYWIKFFSSEQFAAQFTQENSEDWDLV